MFRGSLEENCTTEVNIVMFETKIYCPRGHTDSQGRQQKVVSARDTLEGLTSAAPLVILMLGQSTNITCLERKGLRQLTRGS